MRIIWVHWCWPRRCHHNSRHVVSITQQRLFGFVRKLQTGNQLNSLGIFSPRSVSAHVWIPSIQNHWLVITLTFFVSSLYLYSCYENTSSRGSVDIDLDDLSYWEHYPAGMCFLLRFEWGVFAYFRIVTVMSPYISLSPTRMCVRMTMWSTLA